MKGGGEEGRRWWESEQGLKGKEGENERKRVGGKGPEKVHSKNSDLVPL